MTIELSYYHLYSTIMVEIFLLTTVFTKAKNLIKRMWNDETVLSENLYVSTVDQWEIWVMVELMITGIMYTVSWIGQTMNPEYREEIGFSGFMLVFLLGLSFWTSYLYSEERRIRVKLSKKLNEMVFNNSYTEKKYREIMWCRIWKAFMIGSNMFFVFVAAHATRVLLYALSEYLYTLVNVK